MIRTNYDDVDGVFFDFGGVISVSPMAKWECTLLPFCDRVGLPRQAIWDGFTKYRNLWDGDAITFEQMYCRIFADAGVPEPSAETLAELRRLDAASWVDVLRDDTLALMRDLKAAGKKLGILSNQSSDFYESFFAPRCADYRALVDVEIISGHERTCKPGREIFDRAAARIGLPPARLLFYDDFARNVEAARQYGWQAEIYPARAEKMI